MMKISHILDLKTYLLKEHREALYYWQYGHVTAIFPSFFTRAYLAFSFPSIGIFLVWGPYHIQTSKELKTCD